MPRNIYEKNAANNGYTKRINLNVKPGKFEMKKKFLIGLLEKIPFDRSIFLISNITIVFIIFIQIVFCHLRTSVVLIFNLL